MGIFFTPVGEIGLALQEMWEVSNLPIGSLPYENFPRTVELEQLEKEDSALFETYRELMCHFYIGLDVYHVCGNVNGLKCWADYLFSILEDALEEIQFPLAEKDIAWMMASSGHGLSLIHI